MPRRSNLAVEDTQEYQYVLTNFRIAHEKVEEQRRQLEEQEQQVAQLRARIQRLEGGPELQITAGSNTVDDFSIRNGASQLDKLINRWVSEIVQRPPVPLAKIYEASLNDISSGPEATLATAFTGTPMQVHSLLRHALADCIAEGFINCLIVTNSKDGERPHIFARDPTVAGVWRRQTFSCSQTSHSIFSEHIPHLTELLGLPAQSAIESAFHFSRMLHGTAGGDCVGSTMHASQIELVKRCLKNESAELDRVGCTMFPGIVKVGLDGENTVVRRAQVICECALSPSR
ncbi:hypothetical protein C8F01DRAFT_1220728 [Mycena amicta]|nr:hypothetical protein C8F01DRAFT_1220728 [Mycena amicta]